MPSPIDRSCWGKLEQISQLVGQINGMAYGCKRWNVPAMQGLDIELQSLMSGRFCGPELASLNGLYEMYITNQLALESFGMNIEGFQELAKEEVERKAANYVVGEIQSHWLTVLNDMHKWYAENQITHTNGHANGPIPQEVR